MKFGDILKEYRKQLKLSVNQLSKLSNVSVGYISKLENNKRKFPTTRTLFLLLLGFKNSKINDQSKSIQDVDNEIKYILNEFINAEDSEINSEDLENLYKDFNTFYEDLHKKVGNKDERNRKKNIFVYEDDKKKKHSVNLERPINDIAFHLKDNANQKFYNGVMLNEYDKNMINEIINSFLVTKLSQEQVDLNEDIEQLQKDFNDFRKESMLNKKQLKMFAIHNNIQSLKDK
ncbi:helix-turn-helix transcriptional regulator [Staphylococcus aureus]|jgi:transcriptional regulator with XRE-family HTH domain|uniref:Pathogenicity island DNA-binding protein n=7 Tax=Staphylococcus TaxID=1279 RepID=A0A7Z7QXJ0_STASC|nr:helix-turn-helix domain-containing protein [Staphylococcus aureus]ATV03195.1 XRE family transcriptional regulator [Staphylococcus aureus O11]SUN30332.1 pathogenicity island DNA-binding protein [Staphylococcus schleiferi]HDH6253188.1 helix-turn-helix transcriptional regulator [Staphylococcus aureus LTCF-9-33]HDH6259383.1 helix-turn-helix transcriptional regulator [Staphylococcus aureus LTCF-8-31]HDH6272500.1 helix-turn-helix transcriptional regulator [Staphylococcus aureus LTCF-6-28]HDH6431